MDTRTDILSFFLHRVREAPLAATPPGSKPFPVDQRLIAVTPPGSNAQIYLQAKLMTPEGSQQLAPGRRPGVHTPPTAFTTPEGSEHAFRVRDRSEKPGVASSPRGLAADSPTVSLRTGTPKECRSVLGLRYKVFGLRPDLDAGIVLGLGSKVLGLTWPRQNFVRYVYLTLDLRLRT
jgi:hypothetical protein